MTDYEELYAGEQVCCTCAHFVQHYRRDVRDGEEGYRPIGCGHCLKRRPKRYPPETPACEGWEKK